MLLEEEGKEQKHSSGNKTADQTTTVGKSNGHGQYTQMCGLVKMIFEKISTLLFDQETVSQLLKFIFEKVSNGKEKNKLVFSSKIFVSF
jgi:hypothetical protein